MPRLFLTIVASLLLCSAALLAEPEPLRVRASLLDPACREYPEIDFVFKLNGKETDWQYASAPGEGVQQRGQLVIWMMSHRDELFDRLNDYGLHAIAPHYANKWFSKVCRQVPVGDQARGNVRLEAATGEDFSEEIHLLPQDGMKARAFRFVDWLAKEDPEGGWGQFLNAASGELHWERVIMAGASHGSTTSARFAKHQKVARVVMLCGPRDQYQTWQELDSATPPERYFGFSHSLDMGWKDKHYCRSWQMLGLHAFGPIVDVGTVDPPFANSRRLISSANVQGDAGLAHSAVTPGSKSPKSDDGSFVYEPVWRYLFTHPVEQVGTPTEIDANCVVAPQTGG